MIDAVHGSIDEGGAGLDRPRVRRSGAGCERRTRRLHAMARRLQDDPRTAFPRSLQSTAELEGFYRFVNRDAFEASDIWSRIGSGLPSRTPRPGLGVTTEGKHGFLRMFR
jgi:hypothetical protein